MRPFLALVLAWGLCPPGALAQGSEAQTRAQAERFADQVVRVLPRLVDGSAADTGFGILVGQQNDRLYIATPHHVAFGRDPANRPLNDQPHVVFRSSPFIEVPARRLGAPAASSREDLAVIEVLQRDVPPGFKPPSAPIVGAQGLLAGTWAWNIGIGRDWEMPFRAGGIGTIDLETRWRRVGQLRAPLGASGGAVVTEAGVLGMVLRDGDTFSLALPVERIVELFTGWRLPTNLLLAGEPRRTITGWFRDCDECPELAVVPGGEFTMGSPPGEAGREADEGPQRRVSIRPFAAGVYEVTFAQWDACVAGGGCNRYRPDDESWGRGDRPVINVSWHDAQEYVAWLSRLTRKDYRLLTEAEWEYAARAGTTTAYTFGATITPAHANYPESASGRTQPVGRYLANGFGLHDMHGNVWEWVQDCYRDSYRGAPTDGLRVGDREGCDSIVRGGSWGDDPRFLRSARRGQNAPLNKDNNVGFRVARAL